MFLPLGDNLDKRVFPAVGSVLIAVNVLVYIQQTKLWYQFKPPRTEYVEVFKDYYLKSDYHRFSMQWGLVPEDLPRGHVHTLLTYMFLHGDFFHLLGNMVMLWAFVGSLENLLGSAQFLGYYLLWGVAGGLVHAIMNWGDPLPMIGASGAVSGMIGAYFVSFGALTKIRTLIWLFFYPVKVDVPATLFVVLWGMNQLLGLSHAVEAGHTGIAWYAHVGGFAAGALTMGLVRGKTQRRLVVGRGGTLQLQQNAQTAAETAPALAAVAADAAPPPSNMPSYCPYCGTALEEEHKIHDLLLRCPKPGCNRLVYIR